jgi:hypothetical protein
VNVSSAAAIVEIIMRDAVEKMVAAMTLAESTRKHDEEALWINAGITKLS